MNGFEEFGKLHNVLARDWAVLAQQVFSNIFFYFLLISYNLSIAMMLDCVFDYSKLEGSAMKTLGRAFLRKPM